MLTETYLWYEQYFLHILDAENTSCTKENTKKNHKLFEISYYLK